MSFWGWAARIGGYAAAPWTGGMSIAAGNAAGSYLDNRGKNKSDSDQPEHPEDPYTSALKGSADQLRSEGSEMSGESGQALAPVLNYLKKITGDNPSDILDATRQDRGRVIDQYDTARQTIANFGPRGGGTTSALAKSQFTEGETLADLTSTKRTEAMQMEGTLGTSLAGLGLSAQQLADQDLNSIINSVLTREGFDVQKRGQNMQALAGIAEAAGTIIATYAGKGG